MLFRELEQSLSMVNGLTSKARCALHGLKAAVWGGARALDAENSL